MITIEGLKERLVLLSQQRESLVSQLNATIGALTECEHWLTVAEEASKDKETAAGE